MALSSCFSEVSQYYVHVIMEHIISWDDLMSAELRNTWLDVFSNTVGNSRWVGRWKIDASSRTRVRPGELPATGSHLRMFPVIYFLHHGPQLIKVPVPPWA